MQKFYVIGYRPIGNRTIFYRGKNLQPRVRLGPIYPLDKGGWVTETRAARLFVTYPVFIGTKCIDSSLDTERIVVYEYTDLVTKTNIVLPNM